MTVNIIYLLLLLGPVLGRHIQVPRFHELDEEDQHLFRAAYETPSYEQPASYEEEELPLGKLDLVKDGLWAVKAKLKELKAFDKALAANMLSTKLKLKDLLKNHMAPVIKHHHVEYGYQAPAYQAPQYHPVPQYAPPPQYGEVAYAPPPPLPLPIPVPVPHYGEPAYGPPPPLPLPAPQYAAPQIIHDPYYGH